MNKSLVVGIVIMIFAVFAAGVFTGQGNPVVVVKHPDAALVSASCVGLVQVRDDSFGATTEALIANAGIYKRCSAACLAK